MSSSTAGIFQLASRERALFWCVLASIALHALVLLGVSLQNAPAPPERALLVLTARLAPVATAPQENLSPSQPAAKPAPEPRPALEKPAARRAPAAEAPALPDAVKTVPAEPAPAASGPVASSAPSSAPGQPRSAPQPQSGVKTDATAKSGRDADAGSIEQYRLSLIVATRRYKRYPAIAMEKGWQGRVEVRLAIGANGMITSASIKTSSGHEILDNQAVDMLKKGKTTVQIPASLRGLEFDVDVPVIFNLDNPNS